jgi:hypothetical protein
MIRCDPKKVAVDWLAAYEAASLNQIVAMHSPDGRRPASPIPKSRSGQSRKR